MKKYALRERGLEMSKEGIMSLNLFLYHATAGSAVYSDNLSHDLVPMAQLAGVYHVVLRPEEY